MSVIRHMRPIRPLVSFPASSSLARPRFISAAPSLEESAAVREHDAPNEANVNSRRKRDVVQEIAQAPVATVENPFQRLFALPRGLSGLDYLNAVHLSAFDKRGINQSWLQAADVILSAPCNDSVLESVLHVLSQLQTSTPTETLRLLNATSKFMQAAARSGALTFVEAGVSQSLKLLDVLAAQDLAADGRTSSDVGKRLIHQHHRLVRHLVGNEIDLWGAKSATRLPATVQRSIVRTVRHLLDALESLPSTSSNKATLALRPASIDWLLAPQYCVPESMTLIVDHLQANDIEFTEKQWANLSASCFAAGDALSGLKWLAKSRPKPTAWEQLGVALRAKTFRAAAGILEPLMKHVKRKLPDTTEDELRLGHDSNADERKRTVASADKLQRHAWSVLATIASQDKTMSTAELLKFVSRVPDNVYCAAVVTPILVGLIRHRAWDEASRTWKILLERHRLAAPEERHQYLDPAALTVGAKLKYLSTAAKKSATGVAHYDPTPDAVRLVDFYAAKSSSKRHLIEKYQRTAFDDPGEHPVKVPGSQVLDAGVLNSLMGMCRQVGAAGLAFRLWRASGPRWGVKGDDTTLGLLLDTARLSFFKLESEDSVAIRLRLIADVLGSKKRQETPLDRPDEFWKTCRVDHLVNGYAYSWRAEYGSAQPWELARDVFESVVLGNWPSLSEVKSPLTGGSLSVGGLRGLWSAPKAETDRVPSSGEVLLPASSPYAHLIPGARSFQAYIALLIRTRADPQTVPRALAWMRALGIQPMHKTLVAALLFVNEHEGPRRLVNQLGRPRLMRDEEILAAWLAEWCDNVPDEHEVAHYRREREVRIEHARALARELEQ